MGGPTKTVKFFIRKEKWQGTSSYFVGIGVIIFGWPFCGFVIEMYGVWKLFAAFLPNVIASLKMTVPGASAGLNMWPLSTIRAACPSEASEVDSRSCFDAAASEIWRSTA